MLAGGPDRLVVESVAVAGFVFSHRLGRLGRALDQDRGNQSARSGTQEMMARVRTPLFVASSIE